MIIGMGTDLVDYRRVRRLLAKHPSFVRIMHPSEQQYYCGNIALGAAKTWACKEAVIKAAHGLLRFSDIEITHNGVPQVHVRLDCYERLIHLIESRGSTHDEVRFHLTLTDELPYISATCVLELVIS
jgi:phosphopantetheinyl transferase (holo-ACP synthase)